MLRWRNREKKDGHAHSQVNYDLKAYSTYVVIVACLQVDLVKKEGASAQQQMIRVAEQLNGLHSFQQTFWVSALRAQGMTKLKEFLTQR